MAPLQLKPEARAAGLASGWAKADAPLWGSRAASTGPLGSGRVRLGVACTDLKVVFPDWRQSPEVARLCRSDGASANQSAR